jgi:hypothetical protein
MNERGIVVLAGLLTACTTLDFGALSGEWNRCPADSVVIAGGAECDPVAKDLQGLRVELACKDGGSSSNPALCGCAPTNTSVRTLGGSSGTTYLLTMRARGIIETTPYDGGTPYGGGTGGGAADFVHVGGTNPSAGYNTYSLTASGMGPAFYLNAGEQHSTLYCDAVDYTFELAVSGRADITLQAVANDSATEKNRDKDGNPIPSPPGVEPSNGPFNGQFLQLDVVSVTVSP